MQIHHGQWDDKIHRSVDECLFVINCLIANGNWTMLKNRGRRNREIISYKFVTDAADIENQTSKMICMESTSSNE